MSWTIIFYRCYKINKKGTIIRIRPACGTRKGRALKPYRPKQGSEYVKLCYKDKIVQYRLDYLMKRYCK